MFTRQDLCEFATKGYTMFTRQDLCEFATKGYTMFTRQDLCEFATKGYTMFTWQDLCEFATKGYTMFTWQDLCEFATKGYTMLGVITSLNNMICQQFNTPLMRLQCNSALLLLFKLFYFDVKCDVASEKLALIIIMVEK